MTNEELRTALNKDLKQQQQKRKEETEEFWKRLKQELQEKSQRIEESDRAYLKQVRQEGQQRAEAIQEERKEALKKNLIYAQKLKAPFLRNVSIKSYLETAKTVWFLTAEYFSVLQKEWLIPEDFSFETI